MIDERLEELAALYALDLLEGADRAQFERALARDPELQALVRELRDSAAALAHMAPATTPPTALRDRVLASIESRAQSPLTSAEPDDSKVVRPPTTVFRSLAPWLVAACLALATARLTQLYMSSRSEAALLQQQQSLTALSLQAARNLSEAERLIAARQLADLNQKVTDTTRQLAEATTRADTTAGQLTAAQTQLTASERALADARTEISTRDGQLTTLAQRIVSLSDSASEATRQLAQEKDRVAALTRELQSQSDLAQLKITALASMLKNSPQALAVAVWDPAKQEGVLKVEKLPALAANQDYQLWVVDPQYPNPVDGGVFTVDPATGAQKITFKAKQPVRAIDAFAVTRERKGGVPKAEGEFVLLGK